MYTKQTFLLLHMVHHIFWQQPASVGRLAFVFVCVVIVHVMIYYAMVTDCGVESDIVWRLQ